MELLKVGKDKRALKVWFQFLLCQNPPYRSYRLIQLSSCDKRGFNADVQAQTGHTLAGQEEKGGDGRCSEEDAGRQQVSRIGVSVCTNLSWPL